MMSSSHQVLERNSRASLVCVHDIHEIHTQEQKHITLSLPAASSMRIRLQTPVSTVHCLHVAVNFIMRCRARRANVRDYIEQSFLGSAPTFFANHSSTLPCRNTPSARTGDFLPLERSGGSFLLIRQVESLEMKLSARRSKGLE